MALIIARTLILYVTLLIFMGLLGKRQLGQMELSEFILASLAADMASLPLENTDIPLINGLVPILCLFCFELLTVFWGLRCGRFRELIWGRPSVLIKDGVIDQKELRKNRISLDELLARLRGMDCLGPEELSCAVLETDGSLSIITPGDDGQKRELKLPVISDGRIISRNLKKLGRDRNWLDKKLRELGAESSSQVFYLSLSPGGDTSFVKKEQK